MHPSKKHETQRIPKSGFEHVVTLPALGIPSHLIDVADVKEARVNSRTYPWIVVCTLQHESRKLTVTRKCTYTFLTASPSLSLSIAASHSLPPFFIRLPSLSLSLAASHSLLLPLISHHCLSHCLSLPLAVSYSLPLLATASHSTPLPLPSSHRLSRLPTASHHLPLHHCNPCCLHRQVPGPPPPTT